jgi:hypothetical protein
MDPHQIERWNPDPHQSDMLDPDPHQFADDKQNVWNMSPFEHFLSLYMEARIQIRIRIKEKVGPGSESASK